jgi:hypothetical protein
MATTCPRCAATVRESQGSCPQCGWSAPYLVRPRGRTEQKVSYTERYRGTIYDSGVAVEVAPGGGITRARTFLAIGAAAVATLFGLILTARPPV